MLRRVDQGGELVQLLDFGAAAYVDGRQRLMRTGMVIGTPHYLSPEGACGQRVDARGDVYSFAAVRAVGIGVSDLPRHVGRASTHSKPGIDSDRVLGALSVGDQPAVLDPDIGDQPVPLGARVLRTPRHLFPELDVAVGEACAIAGFDGEDG